MLCLIYEFKVKPGSEQVFREGWHAITALLCKSHGSLGARLHQTTDGRWISYAQWPNRELWLKGDELIGRFLKESNWHQCLEETILLMEMTVTDDLLQPVDQAADAQITLM
jgi:hypothetical protein